MLKNKELKALVSIAVLILLLLAGYLLLRSIMFNNVQNNQAVVNVEKINNRMLEVDKEDSATSLNTDILKQHLNNKENNNLTEIEVAALYYMEEEEKLAYDVYVALGNIWGAKIFENISRAEKTHMESTTAVLEAYGYPSKRNEELGSFNNEILQEYYEALVGDGSVLDVEAILVGGMIEELDIEDLNNYLEIIENEDIKLLFNNLKKGSENHLRAFVRNYERTGNEYFPQLLDEEYYNSILNK